MMSWRAATRTVVMVSRHYFGEPAPDWPEYPMVGFSRWDGPVGQELDPAVSEFIDAGDAPVLVCLGTAAATGAGHAFARIGRGLDDLGLRSLLLVGHAGNLGPVRDRPGVFVFAPVAPVLPRCRVAVVSGALGTLAAALTAGVPVVAVPQLFDQLWHGRRVADLGVGLMVRRPSRVAAAVARIESDPSYRVRAQALAGRLRSEDGAAGLVDAVESVLP
jgi:UDP:flavonoid glycosyltransferase YjiC (YdhE family)